MSIQLVSTGPQDEWLTGQPEMSYFISNYKRATHFAHSLERQVIQGTPAPGNISTVRFERKGDLLNYVYLTAVSNDESMIKNTPVSNLWLNTIDKIDLYIGGQLIDSHDFKYMNIIEPITGSQNLSQLNMSQGDSYFFPLKFFFCKDWTTSIPLVALQFHDVEIRIRWAYPTSPEFSIDLLQIQVWTNYIYLDTPERTWMASNPLDILITQVQTVGPAKSAVQELAFAHPIKFLASRACNYIEKPPYNTQPAKVAQQRLLLQINGIDVGDMRPLPHWTDASTYYHTPFGWLRNPENDIAVTNAIPPNFVVIPWCLDTADLQPTGTLNFSRLDSFRLVVPSSTTIAAVFNGNNIYALNYNVLRIDKGLGSLLYAS